VPLCPSPPLGAIPCPLVQMITTFPFERNIINRERASNSYRVAAYYPAKAAHGVAPARGPHRVLHRRQLLAAALPVHGGQVLHHARHRDAGVQRHERRRTHGTSGVPCSPGSPSRPSPWAPTFSSRAGPSPVWLRLGPLVRSGFRVLPLPVRRTALSLVPMLAGLVAGCIPVCCYRLALQPPLPRQLSRSGPSSRSCSCSSGASDANIDSIPVWIRWFRYLSPIQWGFVGLATNQFTGALVRHNSEDTASRCF